MKVLAVAVSVALCLALPVLAAPNGAKSLLSLDKSNYTCPADPLPLVTVCLQTCQNDTDCLGGLRCCSYGTNGCKKKCMLPVPPVPSITSLQVCPMPSLNIFGGGYPCVVECVADSSCVTGQKCCFTGCGFKCMTPKTVG